MGLTLITAPAEEPITLADAKVHLRVDGTEEDALITALIVAARRQAEHLTGRALVTQTWRCTLPAFPADSLDLPRSPLQSVSSLTYLDPVGASQTLPSADYQAITDEIVGRVLPAYGKSWPACRVAPGSVAVTFVAGYGAAAAVPQDIKSWMLLAIGTWYAQRETVITGTIVGELPRSAWDGLLDPFRIMKVA